MHYWRILTVWAIIFCTSHILVGEQANQPWQPAWYKSEPLGQSNPVIQTTELYVFKVYRYRGFRNEDNAQAFAKQKDVLAIRKIPTTHEGVYYGVDYSDLLDLRRVIPTDQQASWSDTKAQFALLLALRRQYAVVDEIVDGHFIHYHYETFDSADQARQATERYGDIVELSHRYNSEVVDARFRRSIDLVVEARPFLQMLERSYQDFIPTDIAPYRILGPTMGEHGINIEDIWSPGETGFMNYTLPDHPGQGATVRVMKPTQADGLDHDFIRHFVLVRGVKVIRHGEQTIISSNDGTVFLWKFGPHNYYYLAGGYPEVLDAYLKKFPSVLPNDYAFDINAWLREEVRRRVEDLKKDIADEQHPNQYLYDYFYLCRFVEPISGAPVIWPSFLPRKLTDTERKAHFAVVDHWWQQHKNDFSLRKGAPLSHGQIMSLSPTKPADVDKAIGTIGHSNSPE